MNSKDYKKYLVNAGVPEALHEEAIASLLSSRKTFWSDVFFFKLTAPFVVPFIIPFLKWETEKLPKLFSGWDNNISLNGDRSSWHVTEAGYSKRLPAPLDKSIKLTDNGNLLNYYAGANRHVRHWISRLVWLGFRNPGANRALQKGPLVTNHYKRDTSNNSYSFDIEEWGYEEASRNNHGVKIRRLGNYWQITAFRSWKQFKLFDKKYELCLDSNWGYKINNVKYDYDCRDPEARLCVCHTSVPFIRSLV